MIRLLLLGIASALSVGVGAAALQTEADQLETQVMAVAEEGTEEQIVSRPEAPAPTEAPAETQPVVQPEAPAPTEAPTEAQPVVQPETSAPTEAQPVVQPETPAPTEAQPAPETEAAPVVQAPSNTWGSGYCTGYVDANGDGYCDYCHYEQAHACHGYQGGHHGRGPGHHGHGGHC